MAQNERELIANYTSPSSQKSFEHNLAGLSPSSGTKDKTTYLAALRQHTMQMQGDINTFLTERMEDDKATEAVASKATGKKINDEKAEEMYGEEEGADDG